MPNLKSGKECCGCTACEAICNQRAIVMTPDSMGFKYPKVDMSKCVECGMCERVCSFNDHYATPDNFSSPVPYGVRMKEIQEVMKSRSGGAFVAFSDFILDKGGVIYGAGFKDHFVVAHKRAASGEERDEFRGSKYVQSDLTGIFRQVREDLKNGLWVLFSGTPCQVSGLKSFLPEKLQERLVAVDMVCHGVPSPNIWKDFLSYIEDKTKKTVVGVNFRDKQRFGWKAHKESLYLANTPQPVSSSTYAGLFFKNIMLRPSCGECHYCNLRRTGDLTLADFWGWEKTGSHINDDDKGLSLVLVNTQKGKDVFNTVKNQFEVIEPRLEDCLQTHLRVPASLNPMSEKFKADYSEHGFNYVLKKYGNVGLRHKLKAAMRIVKNLPAAIKRKMS